VAAQELEAQLEQKAAAAEALADQLAAAQADLDRRTLDLEESRQQEEAARNGLHDKAQLCLDLMESNQLLQAQLAEAREDAERAVAAQAALAGRHTALEETHQRLQDETWAALAERDGRLTAQEADLAAARADLATLAQQRDAAETRDREHTDRLEAVKVLLTDLEAPMGRLLDLARAEMNKQ
jgi:hypothetical protein